MNIQAADALMGIFGYTRVKQKICRDCKQPYEPFKAMQPRCIPCAIQRGKIKTQKDAALREWIEKKRRKEKLKTRSDWLREAQSEFNKYIRTRDRDLPCISCGRFHTGSYDAGHYRTVGAAPHLRFDEDNCHKQCVPCNQHKGGNIVEYRKGLLARIGLQRLEALENSNESKRYTVEEAKEIKERYKRKVKELSQ